MIHRFTFMFLFAFEIATAQTQKVYEVQSPNLAIKASLQFGDRIYYTVHFNDILVLKPSPISMTLKNGTQLGKGVEPITSKNITVNQVIKTVWGKRKEILDNYNELTLDFKDYELIIRCYNDAVAYRWVTKYKQPIIINNEEANFNFATNNSIWFPIENGFENSFEEHYIPMKISGIKKDNQSYIPVVLKNTKLSMAILESDVSEYPGMHLKYADEIGALNLAGCWAKYPASWTAGGMRNFNLKVESRTDYIASTVGTRVFPWRVLLISGNDKALADNNIVYKLARPLAIQNTEWIKTGKSVWDWWADFQLTGVDFKTGVNNQTYKYYIDFAAKHQIPYVIMDEGWSNTQDLFIANPDIHLEELIAYGKAKNVKLILWCVWHTLDKQMELFMAHCEKIGIAGLKIDFFDRDDQIVTTLYEKMAKTAADHKLLLDFHGCSKPTGLERMYPNIVNYEAVLGNEFNKWSDRVTPAHTMNLPFTRMLAGPMDFTPGGMRNTNALSTFPKLNSLPFVQGTRVRQLAMYILYDAGLQMLCDQPGEYEREPQIMTFLEKVQVNWDETKVIEALMGEYLVLAKKTANDWFLGAMTNDNPREFEIKTDFLEAGKSYEIHILSDGVNAESIATDYKYEKKYITAGETIKIAMVRSGGFAARIVLK